jgi:hypothetical protein
MQAVFAPRLLVRLRELRAAFRVLARIAAFFFRLAAE